MKTGLVALGSSLLLTALAGCGSSGSGSTETDHTFTYSMTALTSEFAPGFYVVVVDQPATSGNNCGSNINAPPAASRSEIQVTSAGSAAVVVNLAKSRFINYYAETIYVDTNRNHVLDNGDLVLGFNGPYGILEGFCNQIGLDDISQTFNWDSLNSRLPGYAPGGPTVWMGPTEPF